MTLLEDQFGVVQWPTAREAYIVSAAAGHLATTEERVLASGRSPQDGAADCSCI